ncbi:MAG: hypothetical protein Q4G33_02205 [bacterium]|nr:hypothetical protein [bacterium]
MKLRIVSILAALIAASSLNVSAANERGGRVIPLAKPACFGYTQIIGDRLCLFDTDCRPIADYSAYSEVDSGDNIYSINDGASICFYNSEGMLFLTLPSGTEYSQSKEEITFKTSIGYSGCATDGKTYHLSYERAQSAAEAAGYSDGYLIRFYGNRFCISKTGGYSYISVDSLLEGSDEALEKKPNVLGNYQISEKLSDGNYIISNRVRGGAYEYGLSDSDGNIIISPRFSVLSQLSNGMWDICSTHSRDSYKYAIEKEITSTPNFIYDEVSTDFGDGLIGVVLTDEGGTRKLYLNEDLEPVIDMSNTDYRLGTFKDGRASAYSYKYGDCIIDLNGGTLLRGYDFGVSVFSRNKNLVYLGNRSFKRCGSVVYLPPDTPPVKEHTVPSDNGEPKQPYYSTDIRVTIDGEPIQSYAVDGRMMISADALAEHGFFTYYHNDTRTFAADRSLKCENKASEVTLEENPVGVMLGYTVKSDISAYINGKYIETETIDGQLLIEAEALCAPPGGEDPDYWMLNYLGISPYLMSGEYDDSTRTLSLYTYTEQEE